MTSDIKSARLPQAQVDCNFADSHPPLTPNEALIESDRCYFCFHAPCISACPTGIDIPSFIRKIATGNLKGSAHDILKQNIMGAVCARVCPTEVLCEGACVRNTEEHKPVAIGALQRYATDWLFDRKIQLFQRGASTGKRVAIVGAGPAGLACAHRLALAGHNAVVFEARAKPAGLNEYGIAAYKVKDDIAQREVEYLLAVGGIELRLGQELGRDITLAKLRSEFDAVFLALGLAGVNALGLEESKISGVFDAVTYIAKLRQTKDLSTLPVGRRVVVIGGGMTAIDIASQMKRLGAEDVTIVYRRGAAQMSASTKEQTWAQTSGVKIKHWAVPKRLLAANGALTAVEFEYTQEGASGKLTGTGESFALEADMLFKAIGQSFAPNAVQSGADLLALMDGRIAVDDKRKTSLANVWAGGDCVAGGQDLTVVAVEDGKRAADAIDQYLRATVK